MELSVEQRSGVTIIAVGGSIDSADNNAFEKLIEELIETRQTRLVADLGQMDFICSMGLGVLVRTYTRLRNEGGFLHLAEPQPIILKLIKTTGLDRLLPIFDSVDQALQ